MSSLRFPAGTGRGEKEKNSAELLHYFRHGSLPLADIRVTFGKPRRRRCRFPGAEGDTGTRSG